MWPINTRRATVGRWHRNHAHEHGSRDDNYTAPVITLAGESAMGSAGGRVDADTHPADKTRRRYRDPALTDESERHSRMIVFVCRRRVMELGGRREGTDEGRCRGVHGNQVGRRPFLQVVSLISVGVGLVEEVDSDGGGGLDDVCVVERDAVNIRTKGS